VSSDRDCFTGDEEWAVVHACQSPCYDRALRERAGKGADAGSPPVLEDEYNLYLDILDPLEPTFERQVFTESLAFLREHWEAEREILVHCNAGRSRSPSILLLFLAKELGVISESDFDSAKADFLSLYPEYWPTTTGIQTYLREHWEELR
jgi:hypothetical protein